MGMDNVFGEPTFEQPRKRFGPIDANEARAIASSVSTRIAENELKEIFQLIEQAANKGEFSIKYDTIQLSSHAKNRLKELGFNVFEPTDTIDWRKKPEPKKMDYSYNPIEVKEADPYSNLYYGEKIKRTMDFD